MNLIQKYNIKEDEVLSSINFLKRSDVVFAATISIKEFNELYILDDVYVVSKSDENITFISKNLEINENSIIFCNTDFVLDLFKILKKFKNLKDVKLITAQSDKSVNNYIYRKKPKIISEWFTVNSNLNKNNLTSIPFGIASTRNNKNIVYKDFVDYNYSEDSKIDKLYCNFNVNTNYFHRANAMKLANDLNSDHETCDNIPRYLKAIHQYKFVLSPWGNGFDTHRFWEVLYAGNVPVTLENNLYKNFQNFPIILINEYKNFTFKKLIDYKIPKNFNYEMLKVSWWFKEVILKNQISNVQNKFIIKIDENEFNKILRNKYYLYKFSKFLKNIKTILRKIHKNINLK